MFARMAACAACAVLLTGAISACGGSSDNGVAARSPSDILAAAMSAVNGATSVHVSGSGVDAGSQVALDLDLASGKGARGNISQGSLSFQLIEIGRLIYLKGSAEFWRHLGGSAAVQLLQGKWFETPADSGSFASLAQLTDMHQLFSSLSSHGVLVKGKTSTINGQKVVAITDSSKGGTLYVATTGKPYPVEILKTGAQGGRFMFDRYNQAVRLSAPTNAISLQQLQSLAAK
jgi:hypothetical protein